MHFIQKHILKTLMYTKYARFRDMRPPKVDSNAYSYHLRALQKDGFAEKTSEGYRLTPRGLFYVDRVSMGNLEPRQQPKIVTMTVLKNQSGAVLMYPKSRQPFINSWVLPVGKVHLTDSTPEDACRRELDEKAGVKSAEVRHIGDCYIKVSINKEIVSNVLAHLCVAKVQDDAVNVEKYSVHWINEEEREQLKLGPAIKRVIEEADTEQDFFFKNYEIDW